jgi:hypothetical protein
MAVDLLVTFSCFAIHEGIKVTLFACTKEGAVLCVLNIQFREVGSRTVLPSYFRGRRRSRTACSVLFVPVTKHCAACSDSYIIPTSCVIHNMPEWYGNGFSEFELLMRQPGKNIRISKNVSWYVTPTFRSNVLFHLQFKRWDNARIANNKQLSHKRCYCGGAKIFTCFACVFVVSLIQHAIRIRQNFICGFSGCTIVFHFIS